MPNPLPLVRSARNSAVAASAAIALVGIVAGAVRLLPWLLDPAVPWRVAAPFARGLATVALEAAVVVGWPVGWALAAARLVESGEARVLQTLGEAPRATVARLARGGASFAAVLAAVALAYGSDANAPGRVATELVAQARASCAKVAEPTTYAIPFTELTWLCAPSREPRLAGAAPGAMGGAMFSAKGARIAGDFRAFELDDADIALSTTPPVAVRVGTLTMHGMAPWAHASSLPAPARAFLLAVTAWLAASLSAYGVLRRALGSRIGAVVLGACGPCAALALMRLLERADARGLSFALLPLAASAACVALSRLQATARAASTGRCKV